MLFLFVQNYYIYAQAITPARMLLFGGVVAGAELVYGTVRWIFPDKEEKKALDRSLSDTNENFQDEQINKEEELKKLQAPSQLFQLINSSTNTNNKQGSNINISSNRGPDKKTESPENNYKKGVQLFNEGKKEEARILLMQAASGGENKEDAVRFLEENYNVQKKDILQQVKTNEGAQTKK